MVTKSSRERVQPVEIRETGSYQIERRKSRVTDKIADAIQYIMLAIVCGSATVLINLKSEQDKQGVKMDNVNASIIAMQQKLEVLSDTKVNKTDYNLAQATLYERLRAVESDQKVIQESFRKFSENSSRR